MNGIKRILSRKGCNNCVFYDGACRNISNLECIENTNESKDNIYYIFIKDPLVEVLKKL